MAKNTSPANEKQRQKTTFLRKKTKAPAPLKKMKPRSRKGISGNRVRSGIHTLENDLFRTMMENTTDHIYFKDSESRFLLINRSCAIGLGLKDPSEAVGKTDFDFFSEGHARQAADDENRIMTSGRPLVGIVEKETWPDGRETWVSTAKFPMRDAKGRIVGIYGISSDVTDFKLGEEARREAVALREINFTLERANTALQKEIADRESAETALARERNLFRTMMDNTSDHTYFKDSGSRFILMNRSLAGSFRLEDPSQAVGKTDFDYFAEQHARQAYDDEQRIIASGQALVGMEEKETWPDGRETWASTTKVPMRDQTGRIIGTFGISRDITERKTMELSVELANAKLADMVNWLEGRNREISVLNEMGKLLEACRSGEEAYAVISSQMGKLIPVHAGRLYLLNGDRGHMEVAASWGDDLRPGEPFSAQDCRAIQNRRVFLADTAYSESFCPHLRMDPGEQAVSMCIPLLAQGETMGILHLRNRREPGGEVFPDVKEELAVTAADHITLALANLTLRETLRVQSIRDALTGLFNRRYLEESMQRELARAKRKGTALGVVMLDVDYLKRINDTFGHEAGDVLLEGIGQWLQSHTRAEDISCRYGGDEFVLILPDSALDSTHQRALQLCAGIRELKMEFHGRPLGSVSASIGVAGFPQHGETRDMLLGVVDTALYKAKAGGRNCVVVAAEDELSI